MTLVVVVGLGLLEVDCGGGGASTRGGDGSGESRQGGPARIGGGGGKGLIKGGATVTLTGAAGGRGGGAGGGGGASGGGGAGGATAGTDGAGTGGAAGEQPHFSFFVTSLSAMQELSGSRVGFGGDLRFGQTGPGAGLRGADEICRTIAERSLPGAGAKIWRAFLSATTGGLDGGPVHAIDRVGSGPWFDRLGRLVALGPDDLVHERPSLADPAIADDLPNEAGIPNHSDGAPGCTGNACPDNHDVLTGTGVDGKLHLEDPSFTCDDWTTAAMWGSPWCGHSWPRSFSGNNWMSALPEGGCAPGVNLEETGAPTPGVRTVGTGGGYGAIYCFALSP